jgi:hypothetical protein
MTTSSYTNRYVICVQNKPKNGYLSMGPLFGPYKTHIWFLLEPPSKKYFNYDDGIAFFINIGTKY